MKEATNTTLKLLPCEVNIIGVLTVLLVQQDLELIVNLALEAFLDPGDRIFVRQLPVHESAAAGLLHNLTAD